MGHLFGKKGYDISDRQWWNKNPEQFDDQVKEFCGRCSGCIPMPANWDDARGGRDDNGKKIDAVEQISQSNVDLLRELRSPKIQKGAYEVWTQKIDQDWVNKYGHRNLRRYRTFVAHGPDDIAAAHEARPELTTDAGCRGCDIAL